MGPLLACVMALCASYIHSTLWRSDDALSSSIFATYLVGRGLYSSRVCYRGCSAHASSCLPAKHKHFLTLTLVIPERFVSYSYIFLLSSKLRFKLKLVENYCYTRGRTTHIFLYILSTSIKITFNIFCFWKKNKTRINIKKGWSSWRCGDAQRFQMSACPRASCKKGCHKQDTWLNCWDGRCGGVSLSRSYKSFLVGAMKRGKYLLAENRERQV